MDTPETAVRLTDTAAGKITELIGANGNAEEQALRVAVRGGGCSGFQYALALDKRRPRTTCSSTRACPWSWTR